MNEASNSSSPLVIYSSQIERSVLEVVAGVAVLRKRQSEVVNGGFYYVAPRTRYCDGNKVRDIS